MSEPAKNVETMLLLAKLYSKLFFALKRPILVVSVKGEI